MPPKQTIESATEAASYCCVGDLAYEKEAEALYTQLFNNFNRDRYKPLKQIMFVDCTIGNEYAYQLILLIRYRRGVESLDFHGTCLTLDCYPHFNVHLQAPKETRYMKKPKHISRFPFSHVLSTHKKLKSLAFASNFISARGAGELVPLFEKHSTHYLPALLKFNISSNLLSDRGACAIAYAFEANTTVLQLYLDNNHITDVGAQALADTLKINTTLQELGLLRNSIADKGAQALAKALETNTTLQELKLSGNSITDKVAQDIAQALERNKADASESGRRPSSAARRASSRARSIHGPSARASDVAQAAAAAPSISSASGGPSTRTRAASKAALFGDRATKRKRTAKPKPPESLRR